MKQDYNFLRGNKRRIHSQSSTKLVSNSISQPIKVLILLILWIGSTSYVFTTPTEKTHEQLRLEALCMP